jgi:hypothetical protein
MEDASDGGQRQRWWGRDRPRGTSERDEMETVGPTPYPAEPGGIWGDTKVRHLLGGPVYAADEEKGKDTGARENCSGVFPIRW